MNVKDRIIEVINFKRIAVSTFESNCGLSNGYVKNLKGSPSAIKLEDILNTYPDINRVWLMTGVGEMINNTESIEKNKNILPSSSTDTDRLIPILPIAAQGGPLNDFIPSIQAHDCERMLSPISGVDFAMPISGDSMAPEYPSGSQVLVKKIDEKAFIEWGKTYVLDTCNGSVIKNLMPSESEGKVRCVSINKEYPPFEVCLTDVFGIYRVLMAMSLK